MKNWKIISILLMIVLVGTVQAQTYVDQWGASSRGSSWPINNDESTTTGDASMGDGEISTGGSSLRGGFDPVEIASGQTVVLTGQLEYVGGGGASGYTHLRYALINQDNMELQYQYTDSAMWATTDTIEHGCYGYGFHPRSGLGQMSNGNGGAGTVWQIGGGTGWNSTWGNSGVPIAAVKQAPRNAEMAKGVYDWAISVEDLGDGTNEVRWYLVAEDNSYWFGGTEIDTAQLSTKFNSICFWTNDDNEATEFKLSGVNVELGEPITVPTAPWQAFYVSQWGASSRGSSWPILNDTTSGTYLDGDAAMGDGNTSTSGSSLCGGFGDPVELRDGQAMIVSGQLEYVGGGGASGYTHLRYALFNQDEMELQNQYTDSAMWVSTDTITHGCYGYGFHPRSGLGQMSNGNGGAGTVWQIGGGTGWNSTWGNSGVPIAAVKQAPRNAEMGEGLYNWAISIEDLGDGTNEVRWYLVAEDNSYWFGGTEIDTAQLSTEFNSICFWTNDDNEATQVNLFEVKVDIGEPIEVPIAPWQAFYVSQWGASSRGSSWPILNDTTSGTFIDGDAAMGDGNTSTSGSSLRGGFGDPVELRDGQAMIVSGQLEYVGGGGASGYTHLRYALIDQDDMELQYQYTDSAMWATTDTIEHGCYGYGFHPRSGLGQMSNGNGGAGTVWQIGGGTGWNSTWGNSGVPIAAVKQAPRNAEMGEGLYNWAISIEDLGDGTNEVRWYLVAEDNSYWFGGTEIDTAQLSTKFNSICFWTNDDNEATQVNLFEVKVDIGDPIEVPIAPWQAFYVSQWGASSLGSSWPILNDTTSGTFIDGDAAMGDGNTSTGGSSLCGGFGDPVELRDGQAMIVSGQLEYVGGGGASGYTHLRYALFDQDDMELQYQYTDSAMWATTDTITHGCYGYGFHPRSGLGQMSNGNGGAGTVWQIGGGTGWNSTWSNSGVPIAAVKQAPRNAEMGEGVYNWAISIEDLGDGTNEVRWYLVAEDNSYWFGGTEIDTAQLSAKFNSICFWTNDDNEATQVNLFEVKVDIGDPIDVPVAPWEPIYVDTWGLMNGYDAGWDLEVGGADGFDGDATISGDAAATGVVAVRGSVGDPVTPTEEEPIILTGQIELVGGGFENMASLRFGLFNSDSAGEATEDASLDSNFVWTGTEKSHYGYMIVPPSGSNVASWNGTAGTWGMVNNGSWFDIDDANNSVISDLGQYPDGAVATAGIYDFAISVKPKGDGQVVNFRVAKDDDSYAFGESKYIETPPTDGFNSIGFALSGSAATEVNLYEVLIDKGDTASVAIDGDAAVETPTTFALQQNYPNPFNPTTNIRFALPKATKVKLAVFDLRGRMVAELINNDMSAGYHSFTFDAANLASGVYIYQIKAGDFVSTKKLMLLK